MEFVTRCVEAEYDDLIAMYDTKRQITYRTARRIVGTALVDLARSLGYPRSAGRGPGAP